MNRRSYRTPRRVYSDYDCAHEEEETATDSYTNYSRDDDRFTDNEHFAHNHMLDIGRIGSFNQPLARGNDTGIRPPGITSRNFEVNPRLMKSIQQVKFAGTRDQNPLDHLDTFDSFCNMYKTGEVPLSTMKMMLFPFSLEGVAVQWEKESPSASVSTWEKVKSEFLTTFFSKKKKSKIRGYIGSFKQGKKEAFHEGWNRLKGYTRACPHHGFNNNALLGIFYQGCNTKSRELLDQSSRGNFVDNSARTGELVITKLAKNEKNYREDSGSESDHEDETISSKKTTVEMENSQQVKTIDQRVDKIDVISEDYRANILGEIENEIYAREIYHVDIDVKHEEEPTATSAEPDSSSLFEEIRSMLDNVIKTQNDNIAVMNEKLERVELLHTEGLMELDMQFRFLVSSVHTLLGQKEKLIPSTKPVQAVTQIKLRSGRELPMRTPRVVVLNDDINEGEEPKDRKRANEAIPLIHEAWQQNEDKSDVVEEVTEIPHPAKESPVDTTAEIPHPARVNQGKKVQFDFSQYEPPLPYPGRFKKQTLERHQNQLKRILDKIEIMMSFPEMLDVCPTYAKLLKDLLTKRM